MDEHLTDSYHRQRIRAVGSQLPKWAKPSDPLPDFEVPDLVRDDLIWVRGGDVRSRTQTAVLVALFAKLKYNLPVFYWTEEDFADQRRQVWVYQRTAFSSGDDLLLGQYHAAEQEFVDFMSKPILIFDHMAALDLLPTGMVDEVTKMLVDRIDHLELTTIICGDDQRVRRVYGRNEVLGSLLSRAVAVDAVE